MKRYLRHSFFKRCTSALVVCIQLLLCIPTADVVAAVSSETRNAEAQNPTPVNRTVPKVTPVPAFPNFSETPSDEEITRARVFEEPLIPMSGQSSAEENRQLAKALMTYLRSGVNEELSPVEKFLEQHQDSIWRASLLTDMGIVYRKTGYFSKALDAWHLAWILSKNESGPLPRAIADRAVAEWAELNARLGRYDVLQTLFDEISSRDIGGSAAEKLRAAKQGLWLMENRPQDAFRCGPMALDRLLAFEHGVAYRQDLRIKESRSTLRGISLVELRDLGNELGMNLQMAQRERGAEVVLPAVVHWKVGHYAALLKEKDGRYLVQDPTFGDEFWVSRTALDAESSGFFLIAAGKLPSRWSQMSENEGKQVWGKGNAGGSSSEEITEGEPKAHPDEDCTGMAVYNVHLMLVNLNIADMPVGYYPPRGPAVRFKVTYNHRESFQPAVFTYSNLGPKWTFDWESYIKDDPANLNASAYLYSRGGGQETYTGFSSGTQSYNLHPQSRATLVRTSSSPIRYERRLPDGSIEVFAQADGASTFPRRVFLTESTDPAGNTISFTYDSNLRLTAVTDAIGQVTTVSYELAGDSLKITKVTDPFGRFATFEYNSNGRLQRITDVVGITSQFSYASGDFINTMTTPYGATSFQYYDGGQHRWLEATDPLGATEHIEYRHDAPGISGSDAAGTVPTGMSTTNTYLTYRNSFYWDKRAWALYPNDYTKAVLYHWLHTTDINVTSGVLESMKRPLENRVWFNYPGQSQSYSVGTLEQPTAIGRVLDDGTTQLSKYEYNGAGMRIKAIDPLNRETAFTYGANNTPDSNPATGTGLDLLEVKEKNGASYDTLQSLTYNSKHEPLTITDTARQVTTFTYRTNGDVETIITPPRSGLTQAQRTTTFSYYADNAALGPGRLQTIAGPVSGATTSFAYDSKGRLHTVTQSDGYAVSTDYDDLDRPTASTYPDGTTEQMVYDRLDLVRSKDRLNRWTLFFYDAQRRLILKRDPLNQTVRQEWCKCGALEKLIDANGNVTTWERDAQSRVTKEVRANSSFTQFVYETTTSRLKRRTDAKGQHTDRTYFKDNNLNTISYPNASPSTSSVSYTYDTVYNRVATMVDGTGSTTYSYYPVTTEGTLGATQLSAVDGPLSNDTISYTYDELGRISSRSIDGTANQVMNTYDELGRISSISNPLGTFDYTYVDQTQRLSAVDYPNGQTTSFSYFTNSGDRRLSEIHNQFSGGATLSKFNYTYDAVGNIKMWTQQRDSGGSATIRAYDFTYDPTDQLVTATDRTADAVPTILKRYGYAYDAAGNRTTEQIDDVPTKATYNNMNRLVGHEPGGTVRFSGTVNEAALVTVNGKVAPVNASNEFGTTVITNAGTSSITVIAKDYSGNQRTNTYDYSTSGSTTTFTYDANGNTTNDGLRTFEWDAENRLVAIVNGTHRSEFSYDGANRRVRVVEKDNGSTVDDRRFLWCDLEICEERDSTGSTVTRRFYVQGVQDHSDALYYTRDHLGSVREITDASQTIDARYDYDPNGRSTRISGSYESVFAYTGHYLHSQSGILLTLYRAYDPSIGRWLSEDPLQHPDNNRYRYVLNRGIILWDPLGLNWQENFVQGMTLVGTLIGGTIGGAGGGLGGTVVAPGVGTLGGGAVGAMEGAALGAAAGATVGSGILLFANLVNQWNKRPDDGDDDPEFCEPRGKQPNPQGDNRAKNEQFQDALQELGIKPGSDRARQLHDAITGQGLENAKAIINYARNVLGW